jgi:hypothetical protein
LFCPVCFAKTKLILLGTSYNNIINRIIVIFYSGSAVKNFII